MNPKINTSLRSRGKWGDFLIALLPLSWCASILLNSTFILRMIEWQNEANLLTIRIHGKQWYWVYKFDIKDLNNIWNAPKNIGRNRWVIHSADSLVVSNFYLESVLIRSKQVWLKNYWKNVFDKNIQTNSTLDLSLSENIKNTKNINYHYESEAIEDTWDVKTNARVSKSTGPFRVIKPVITNYNFKKISEIISYRFFDSNNKIIQKPDSADANFLVIKQKRYKKKQKILTTNEKIYDKSKEDVWYDYKSEFYISEKDKEINNEWLMNKYKSIFNFDNFSFNVLKKKYIFKEDLILQLKEEWKNKIFNANADGISIDFFFFNPVIFDTNNFVWSDVLAQKLKLFPFNFKEIVQVFMDKHFFKAMMRARAYKGYARIKDPYICSRVLLDAQIADNLTYITMEIKEQKVLSSHGFYRCVRNNRKFSETYPVTLARRLLRTKRTLILPVHVNIGVVTNSYDVVHSWFVPGLGLKMDCVPGRSTHHSLYLDNVGFYYGQCAEICGRFHHHMPIRLCGLPFEHFVVWWQTKGLPKILKLNKSPNKYSSLEKYPQITQDQKLLNQGKYIW